MTGRRRTTALPLLASVAVLALALVRPAALSAAPPVALDDAATISEDAGATVLDVLANDTADEGVATVIEVGTPTLGIATVGDGLDVTYTPDPDATGIDAFTYTMAANGQEATATITVTIEPVNDAPVAVDDPVSPCHPFPGPGGSFPIPEDWRGGSPGLEGWFLFLGGTPCGLLENDLDVDGDDLEFATIGDPTAGAVMQVDPTSLAYDPDPDVSSAQGDWVTDTIPYTVTDGIATSNEAELRIWVAPINDPPTFTAGDDVTVAEDSGAYSAAWATGISAGPANEADQALEFVVTEVDTNGVALFADPPTIAPDGMLAFRPAADAVGLADVTVQLTDDGGLDDWDMLPGTIDAPDDTSDAVTFRIAVTATDDAAVAVDDEATLDEDDPQTTIDVLANDTDVDGGAFVVTAVSQPAKGTTSIGPGGATVRYTPAADANGSDTFTYTITGGDSATVEVQVSPAPDAPVADDDSVTVTEDAPTAVAVPVLIGDSDPDGDALTITAKTNGAKGIVTITGGGTGLTYKPNPNLFGADTFTYTISDGTGRTDTGSVSVTITPVNDKPSALNDAVEVPVGAGPTQLAVLANDLDIDGDALTIVSRTNGAKGTVTITNGGSRVAYAPAAGATGTDTFTYTVSDGKGGTDPATVVVTLIPDTSPPVVGGLTVALDPQVLATGSAPTIAVDLGWTGSDGGRPRRGWYDPGAAVTFQLQRSVDGGSYTTVALDAPTATAARVLLQPDRQVRFRVRAIDGAGNASAYQSFPPLTPRLLQQTDPSITYTGDWSTSTDSRMSGGSGRHTSAAAARATVTFTARAVGWVTTWTPGSGRVEVRVDGTPAATLDPDVATNQYRQVAFTSTWTTSGEHVLEIRPTGDGRVDVDAIIVLE